MSGDDVAWLRPFPSDAGDAVDGEWPRPVNPPPFPGLLNGDFSRIDTILGAFYTFSYRDRSLYSFFLGLCADSGPYIITIAAYASPERVTAGTLSIRRGERETTQAHVAP